jgi:hypothetical protein
MGRAGCVASSRAGWLPNRSSAVQHRTSRNRSIDIVQSFLHQRARVIRKRAWQRLEARPRNCDGARAKRCSPNRRLGCSSPQVTCASVHALAPSAPLQHASAHAEWSSLARKRAAPGGTSGSTHRTRPRLPCLVVFVQVEWLHSTSCPFTSATATDCTLAVCKPSAEHGACAAARPRRHTDLLWCCVGNSGSPLPIHKRAYSQQRRTAPSLHVQAERGANGACAVTRPRRVHLPAAHEHTRTFQPTG